MHLFKGLFQVLIYYGITSIIVGFPDFWMVLRIVHAVFDKLIEEG